MYLYGYGVNKDSAESAKWLLRAAMQGSTKGEGLISAAYLKGEGVPKSVLEGLAWLHLAAASGFPGASAIEQDASASLGKADMTKVFRRAKELSDTIRPEQTDPLQTP
jgi:TPR repeat protein